MIFYTGLATQVGMVLGSLLCCPEFATQDNYFILAGDINKKVMKYILSLFFVLLVSSCFLLVNEKLMLKKFLSNGTTIELYYTGGGTTDSDIIWIKKTTNDEQEIRIGKIKGFTNSDKVVIKEVDPTHISLTFVKNLFPDNPVVFLIDLNNKIGRNDGSTFNEPE